MAEGGKTNKINIGQLLRYKNKKKNDNLFKNEEEYGEYMKIFVILLIYKFKL